MYTLIKYTGFILGMLIFVLTAQATEINFLSGDFEAAKAKAKEERKLIFVDAYAVWCGPCKMMDRNTFGNAKVADYFNQNFVNLKMDVERGQGPDFASQYGINAMPTLLFLDYKGKVIVKKLGYQGPKELMKLAEEADSPENYEGYYSLAVEEGSSDPEVLLNYSLILAQKNANFEEAALKYFATQSDKDLIKNPDNWKAINKLTTDFNSREFKYLVKKQKKFKKKFGKEAVEEKINEVLEQAVLKAANTEDESTYLKAIQMAESSLKDKGQTADRLKMQYAKSKEDWPSFAQRAANYFDTYTITSAKELSSAAWLLYRYIDEQDQLAKAITWVKQSIALENEYYNNKTLAFLLFKTKDLSEARKAAYKTRKIAELQGLDMSEMEDLLEMIDEG